MDWFASHVYVASWCSLLVTVIGLVVKNARPSATQADWSSTMVYITYLTCLAVAVTPAFDEKARGMATGIVAIGFGWFLLNIRK